MGNRRRLQKHRQRGMNKRLKGCKVNKTRLAAAIEKLTLGKKE